MTARRIDETLPFLIGLDICACFWPRSVTPQKPALELSCFKHGRADIYVTEIDLAAEGTELSL